METSVTNFHVITGGPGVGKTTLLQALHRHGYQTVPEDARRIIKQQMARQGNGLPWIDKAYYAQLMIDASVETYKRVLSAEFSGIVFFDRGLIDALCYMDMENIPLSMDTYHLADAVRYNKRIFLLPPWKEIYETDSERKQTWEEAVYTFDKMKETYLKYGYQIIEVPKDTVENRAQFIIHSLLE